MPLRLRPAWMLSLIDISWLCTAVIDTCDACRAACAAFWSDVAPPLGPQAGVTTATGFPENTFVLPVRPVTHVNVHAPVNPLQVADAPPKEHVTVPFGATGPHAKPAGKDGGGWASPIAGGGWAGTIAGGGW